MSGMEPIFPIPHALLKCCTSSLKIFWFAATSSRLANEHSPAFHRLARQTFHRLAPHRMASAGLETSHRDPVARAALPQFFPKLPLPR